MKIILNKNKLIRSIKNQKNLGFVPTMGAIHKGHISLIKKSNSICDKTLVSIFINKPQFNSRNDYKEYPRILRKDIAILKKNKVDFLYLPNMKQIYPEKKIKKLKIHSFSKQLCGKNRPGHFEAVVNVVNRFIRITKPKKIFLGQKDYQQLRLIDFFFLKNKILTKVIGCKTVREKNGIAYSSRNLLLSNKEKEIASRVYKIIYSAKKKLIKKKKKY